MHPANIEDHWPWVLQGIEQINRKADTPCDPQEVLKACKETRAFLFVAPGAFCVLQPKPNRLHVWLTYAESLGAIAQHYSFIIEKAEQIGVATITGRITRKGWLRKLKGWKVNSQNMIEKQV